MKRINGDGALSCTLAAIVALVVFAPAAEARDPSCRTTTVKTTAGQSVRLALDCSVTARGRVRVLARGTTGRATRSITGKPRHGKLTGFSSRRGSAVYRPTAGFTGGDIVRFRVKLPGGKRYRGAVRIKVAAAGTVAPPGSGPAGPEPNAGQGDQPAPGGDAPGSGTPDGNEPDPDPPAGDGLPKELPLAAGSVAYTTRNWQPTAWDTCPKSVHDRFAVIGPDGKKYPTWHPPTVVDPATGETCTFGHEHGRDPADSDLAGWAADHLAADGKREFAGLPFGLATEALNDWAAANPGTPTRQEDHVGYKVDYENDVRLIGTNGADLGVRCDYLTLVHQGSHSPDATANNVHELLHAVRCSDGTELISSTVSRFGDPGEYTRSCDQAVDVPTIPNGYPGGGGARSIPDRECVEANFLVPPGRTTSVWALYEKWSSQNTLRTADPGDPPLASFDAAFGVFNPSRYADPSSGPRIGRTLDLCWEVEPNGHRADSVECDESTEEGTIAAPYAFDDPRSEFNGTYRDFYLRQTELDNDGGPVALVHRSVRRQRVDDAVPGRGLPAGRQHDPGHAGAAGAGLRSQSAERRGGGARPQLRRSVEGAQVNGGDGRYVPRMFDLDAALRRVIESDGSDLHLKVPSPPLIRRHGVLEPIQGEQPLTPEDTEEVLVRLLKDKDKLTEFAEEHEVDFSFGVPGLARFRVNAFQQRGVISIVCRAVPHEIKTIDQLGLPGGHLGDRRRGARDHPADRHDRLGQVLDARGDDRPDQLFARQAHRHDRGPDRVPAPGQALGRSTSARSARTPLRSSAPCAACCARTRT